MQILCYTSAGDEKFKDSITCSITLSQLKAHIASRQGWNVKDFDLFLKTGADPGVLGDNHAKAELTTIGFAEQGKVAICRTSAAGPRLSVRTPCIDISDSTVMAMPPFLVDQQEE